MNQLNRFGVLQKLDQKFEQKLGTNFCPNFSYQHPYLADTNVGAKVRGLTFAPTLASLCTFMVPTLSSCHVANFMPNIDYHIWLESSECQLSNPLGITSIGHLQLKLRSFEEGMVAGFGVQRLR